MRALTEGGDFKGNEPMAKNNWETYFNAVRKEDWKAAKNILQLISKQDKNNPQTFTKIGDVCRRTGDKTDAIAAYTRAAQLLRAKGFAQKALATYKIALRLEPGNPEVIQRAELLMVELDAARRAPRIPALISAKPQTATEDLTEAVKELFTPLSERQERSKPEILRDLPEAMITSFMNDLTIRKYSDRQKIIEEGDSGDSMFIIRSGKTSVVTHILGREIELAVLDEGDVFGEVGFLTGRPRTAAVIAVGPVEVYEISRLDIEKLLETNPEIIARIEDFYETRVRDTIRKLKS
jgi:hypothetical protein